MEQSKLDNIFNVAPIEPARLPVEIPVSKEADQEDDYQLARNTLRRLILKGEDALDDAVDLAKNSEHPRAYEVAGQMIKTMSDVAKDLMNLQKQARDLQKREEQTSIGTQNNIVFAGSTQELLDMIKGNDAKTIDQS